MNDGNSASSSTPNRKLPTGGSGTAPVQSHRQPATWDNIFLDMALAIACRSKDPSTQAGAVVVGPDNVPVSHGFNGPPAGGDDSVIPWVGPEKYPWIIHAEENAIRFGARSRGWVGLADCRIYTTCVPCSRCLLRVAAEGIRKVIYIAGQTFRSYTAEDAKLSAQIAAHYGMEIKECEYVF